MHHGSKRGLTDSASRTKASREELEARVSKHALREVLTRAEELLGASLTLRHKEENTACVQDGPGVRTGDQGVLPIVRFRCHFHEATWKRLEPRGLKFVSADGTSVKQVVETRPSFPTGTPRPGQLRPPPPDATTATLCKATAPLAYLGSPLAPARCRYTVVPFTKFPLETEAARFAPRRAPGRRSSSPASRQACRVPAPPHRPDVPLSFASRDAGVSYLGQSPKPV